MLELWRRVFDAEPEISTDALTVQPTGEDHPRLSIDFDPAGGAHLLLDTGPPDLAAPRDSNADELEQKIQAEGCPVSVLVYGVPLDGAVSR